MVASQGFDHPSPDPSPAHLIGASSRQRVVRAATRALASDVGDLPDEDRLILNRINGIPARCSGVAPRSPERNFVRRLDDLQTRPARRVV